MISARKLAVASVLTAAFGSGSGSGSGTASAQPVAGLYLGGGLGGNLLEEAEDTLPPVPGTPDVTGVRAEAEFEWGYAGVLSLGWGFGNGLRAEIEGSYRQSEVDEVRVSVVPGGDLVPNARPGGYARSYGAMANLLYDIGATMGWPVQVTLGGGLGYIWHDYDDVRSAPPAASGVTIDGTEGAFAYQGIAGLSVPIAPVSGLYVTAEYRFLGTLGHDIDARVMNANFVPSTATNGVFEADNQNHSVLVGLRYNFGQRAPAPAPAPVAAAPAPAPARTYLVFFDWDRADLTDRARQIVGEAANSARTQQVTRLEVAGHADRSGTPQYNQRLSQRRAEAVAAELVRQGVPRQAISVTAFGETRPLVPTADGVREPQNRRVEIVLR